MRRSLRESVLSRLTIDPSGCLLWTATLNIHGYGRFTYARRSYTVHRLMYEWFVGPIPPGYQMDHLCRVRHCAAPAHLEAVLPAENTYRGIGPTAVNAAKTHCPQGHPYDETNTFTWRRPSGGIHRRCRQCKRETDRRLRRAS